MKNFNLETDIYYKKEYASIYVNKTLGQELFDFKYIEGENYFINLAVKRPIDKIKNKSVKDIWYDLETPYGYGGYYTNTDDEKFIETALNLYMQRCKEEKIIAEFIRFHPFNDFSLKHANKLNFCSLDRAVVIVDLSQSKEDRWLNYGSTTRNILRKCEKSMNILESKNIDLFSRLYSETMSRNKADDFYYFDKSYLKDILKISGVNLYEVQTGISNDINTGIDIIDQKRKHTIAVGFFMFGQDLAHYHLSASDGDYMKLNANYFLLETMFEKARNLGLKYFMLGGGRTNNPEDALFVFKQKFSKQTKDFYIAGKIFNDGKYKEYCNIWLDKSTGDEKQLFLKYRGK